MEEPNAVRPGFLYYLMEGFARIFDVRSNFSRLSYSGDGFEADMEALRSDWIVLGNDMRIAMGEFERQAAAEIEQAS